MPAMHKAVILEALTAEQHLVGVQCLGARQWRNSWAAGREKGREEKGEGLVVISNICVMAYGTHSSKFGVHWVPSPLVSLS